MLHAVLLAAILGQVDLVKVPHGDDETSLVRIKAAPDEHVDKIFILCGGLRISDYYNYSYADSEESHYSLDFREVGKTNADVGSEQVQLYLLRTNGAAAIDEIVRTAEKDKTINRPRLARVKATIIPLRWRSDKRWDMLELLDVQFLSDDHKSWGPWVIEAAAKAERQKQVAAFKAQQAERAAKDAAKENAKAKLAKAKEAARWRTWTGTDGTQFRARFSGVLGGKARLKQETGEIIEIAVDHLPEEQQAWITDKKWQIED